ncbi:LACHRYMATORY-FACTOR SYNTHASE [Salix purpurea]|uniref:LACHRYMATORY-FACTOR SYNTHASE n=1 Tax=Salix purpurea TaxID=77065 RepID=A0A9Q0Q141_SALPP|nr:LACHRYMATORY-FACTOR SYNTHASE [Salix purpurea]
MAEKAQGKWEGKATVELKGPTADQVWPFFEDFCNLQKWLPLVDSCHRVEGELGQPGLVRLCKFSKVSSDGSHEETEIKWAKEKLIMIDPNERCLSYEILENNVGFQSYVATIKVLPINDGDGEGHHGCEIEWSFVTDPIEGWPLEDFNSYIKSSLQFMGQQMEQAVLSRQKTEPRWEGKAMVELNQACCLCSLYKWLPAQCSIGSEVSWAIEK